MDDCLESLKSCFPSRGRHRRAPSNNAGEERELTSYPQQGNRPRVSQQGRTSSNIPTSSQAQTQAENAPREVDAADFNRYMTVERITGEVKEDRSGAHLVGHNFLVTVTVKNNTSESLKFTSIPPIEWKETIHKTVDGEDKSEPEQDQYAKNPDSNTFKPWQRSWDDLTVAPNQQKQLLIQDNPSLGNTKGSRTASRSVDFDIGLPGSDKRLRATQNIEIVNGQVMRNRFDIH